MPKTVSPGSITTVAPQLWSSPQVVTQRGSQHLAKDRTKPTVPTNVVAQATSPTTVSLTWDASTDPVVAGETTSGMKEYRIFRNSVKIAATDKSVRAYTDTGRTPGAIYQYRIAAVDKQNNQSGQSPQVTVTMPEIPLDPDTTAPTVPTNLLATADSETQITLTWSASTDPTVSGATTSGLAGYKIRRGGTLIATLGLVTTYPDTGLTPATQYSYRISAIDVAANESAQSAAAVATTTSPGENPDITPPSVPSGLTAVAQSTSSIELNWSASTDPVIGGEETSGLAGYRVRRGGTVIANLGLVTTHLDSGLAANTQYSYTVASVDLAGNESAQSAAQVATTQANTYSLNVAWTPATLNNDGSAIGTILSHNIYASLTAGAPYEIVQNVPWTGSPSAVLTLPSGGTWYVVVTTVTADGESIASAETSRAANVS